MINTFRIRAGLQKTREERDTYNAKLTLLLKDEGYSKVFDHLLDYLRILDMKSTGLLQFNAIMMTVISIFLTFEKMTRAPRAFLLVTFFIIVCSSLLLIYVLWVRWSGLESLESAEERADLLLKARNERTVLYRIGWNCSFVGMLLLLGFVGYFYLFI